MLGSGAKFCMAMAAVVVLFSTGCFHQVKPIPKVELYRTTPHSLLLRNNTAGTLELLPVKDVKSKAAIELAPGDTASISFRLIKIADMEPTDRQWMRLIDGSELVIIEAAAPVLTTTT